MSQLTNNVEAPSQFSADSYTSVNNEPKKEPLSKMSQAEWDALWADEPEEDVAAYKRESITEITKEAKAHEAPASRASRVFTVIGRALLGIATMGISEGIIAIKDIVQHVARHKALERSAAEMQQKNEIRQQNADIASKILDYSENYGKMPDDLRIAIIEVNQALGISPSLWETMVPRMQEAILAHDTVVTADFLEDLAVDVLRNLDTEMGAEKKAVQDFNKNIISGLMGDTSRLPEDFQNIVGQAENMAAKHELDMGKVKDLAQQALLAHQGGNITLDEFTDCLQDSIQTVYESKQQEIANRPQEIIAQQQNSALSAALRDAFEEAGVPTEGRDMARLVSDLKEAFPKLAEHLQDYCSDSDSAANEKHLKFWIKDHADDIAAFARFHSILQSEYESGVTVHRGYDKDTDLTLLQKSLAEVRDSIKYDPALNYTQIRDRFDQAKHAFWTVKNSFLRDLESLDGFSDKMTTRLWDAVKKDLRFRDPDVLRDIAVFNGVYDIESSPVYTKVKGYPNADEIYNILSDARNAIETALVDKILNHELSSQFIENLRLGAEKNGVNLDIGSEKALREYLSSRDWSELGDDVEIVLMASLEGIFEKSSLQNELGSLNAAIAKKREEIKDFYPTSKAQQEQKHQMEVDYKKLQYMGDILLALKNDTPVFQERNARLEKEQQLKQLEDNIDWASPDSYKEYYFARMKATGQYDKLVERMKKRN